MRTQETQPYTYIPPAQGTKKLPILISIPHCGSTIPPELKKQLSKKAGEEVEDTDWFVEKLYAFAPEIGIGILHGNYSRYVVDLNRPIENKPLYKDGRFTTGIFPLYSFQKEKLYVEEVYLENKGISLAEQERRLSLYYKPYHRALTEKLEELKKEFSQILLWEAHSIKRLLPAIHPKPFPDLILGDGNAATAKKDIIKLCLESLERSNYSFTYNQPFQGGYITRHYSNPEQGIHAVQLEMSQDIYMEEKRKEILPQPFSSLQNVLLQLLKTLGKTLGA